MSERILVTGGTGFVGSHLVEALVTAGTNPDRLHVTSFSNTDRPEWLPDSVHLHSLDLTNLADIVYLLQETQPTHIYHLAAIAEAGASFDQAHRTIINNTSLQLNILEALKEHATEARVLVIGSAQEYRVTPNDQTPKKETDELGPPNPYGVSKVTQDLLALAYWQAYGLPIIRVRPFNHTGERQTTHFAIPAFAKQIAAIERGEQSELQVGNLSAVRDISDVKDVVQAYMLLMTKGQPGEVYNVGTGQGQSMQAVLNLLITMAKTTINIKDDPSRHRPSDTPYLVADITRLQQLGWQPQYQLEQTLSRVLKYWREQS